MQPASTLIEADTNFMHHDTAALDALNYPNVLETIRQRFSTAAVSADKHFIYVSCAHDRGTIKVL